MVRLLELRFIRMKILLRVVSGRKRILFYLVISGKQRKRAKRGEVESRCEVNEVDGERVFVCGEVECEFYSNKVIVMKQHEANIQVIGVKYYFCNQKGCDYERRLMISV